MRLFSLVGNRVGETQWVITVTLFTKQVWHLLDQPGDQKWFNPLSHNSDENEISLYIITPCSNIQVMRIKEVIIKDKMS